MTSDRRSRKPSSELVRSSQRIRWRFVPNLAWVRSWSRRVRATKDLPTPTGPNRAVDATWSVRSSTSFKISSRGRRFVGTRERAGVEVSLALVPEVWSLVVEGVFSNVNDSPGGIGDVFVLLWYASVKLRCSNEAPKTNGSFKASASPLLVSEVTFPALDSGETVVEWSFGVVGDSPGSAGRGLETSWGLLR